MKKNIFLFYILICFSILNSCRKNDTITPPTDTIVNDTETVTASVRGVVVNENDIPIMGATVTIGTFTSTTNAYGVFEFTNKLISKNNTHVKVVKSGYFNGNRSMMSTANNTIPVRIKLQPKTITGTVNAASGGSVTLATGGKVTFPANVIVDASGNAYTGVVNVAMAYINPTANDLASTLQGDLRGVTTIGTEMVLETYGMLGVELTGASGQALKIATGKSAELTTPIPLSLQTTAPATIPLWNFDETIGRWKEEGIATKVGNNYIGNVAHFSFWNCDVALQTVTLCVTVVTPNNQPISNAVVRLRRVNNPASVSYGYTDSTGKVCGAVPKNEALTLEILDRCGSVVYTQNIGPYSTNASVTVTATIPAANTVILTGNVTNCSNTAVTNGSVYIVTNNGYMYSVGLNATGAFSLTLLNCNSSTINYTVLPIDNAAAQQGAAVGGSAISGTVNLGTLQACGTSSVQYVNTLIDGVPYAWVTPVDSLISSLIVNSNPYPFGIAFYANGIPTSGTNTNAYSISFNYNATIGVYPILNSYISIKLATNTFMTSQQINSANPQVNLTAIGNSLTGFLEGNYNVTMLFNPGAITRNVQCNFKVRRP